jgi:hypothetical protein
MLAPRNKSQTQTRHELSWSEVIWGPTDRPTNQPTDGQRIYVGYIWDIFQIHPRFIWVMNAFGIYPRYIPDVSLIYTTCSTNNIPDSSDIPDLSRIYPDLSRMTDSSGIYLFIPQISGIPRLGGTEVLART